MKTVQFKDNLVEYEPLDTHAPVKSVQLKTKDEAVWDTIPNWTKGLMAALILAIFIIWVISLVRMGRCNGRKSWLFWCSIFIPIFVPGVGQAWALIVGIMAIVILGRGGELAGMKCKK